MRSRGRYPYAIACKFAFRDVDDRALYAGAADVDSQNKFFSHRGKINCFFRPITSKNWDRPDGFEKNSLQKGARNAELLALISVL